MRTNHIVEWMESGHVSIPKLLIKNYAQIGLSENEFTMLLLVYTYQLEGNQFPTPDELATHMNCSALQCTELLHTLIRKQCLIIEETVDDEGKRSEGYSLRPLWEKLAHVLTELTVETEKLAEEDKEQNVFALFEKEFGRPLSPIEIETLSYWLDVDKHSYQLIKLALRESVLSGKLSFRYIDRILFTWKKNGIKTVEQARQHSQKFYNHKQQSAKKGKENEQHNISIPFYNWLES